MLIFVVLLAVTSFLLSVQSDAVDKKYSALRFGNTPNDYIKFDYNMARFSNALTICTWIRRVHISSYPVVFHYYTSSTHYEILIASEGVYNRVLDDRVLENLNTKFTTQVGHWFHYCLSWSSSSHTIRVYVNGELVGSGQTSSSRRRALHTSGTIRFGRLDNSANSYHVFGGEIYQLNVYTKVLSSETIKRIADGGMCFDLEEFSDNRILRWEEIMTKSRSGSVTEIKVCMSRKELEAKLSTVTGQLNNTQQNLETVTSKLNSTQIELQTLTDNFDTLTGHLNSTRKDLKAATSRLNQTEGQLETCSSVLNDTKAELDGARKLKNITKWDTLYTSPFYHKILTSELLEELKKSWDLLEEFVGVNVTESIVEHLRTHDTGEAECGKQINDILDMWDELVGDKMVVTGGIIQHFREKHNDTPCDD